jgi:hypothetical protein
MGNIPRRHWDVIKITDKATTELLPGNILTLIADGLLEPGVEPSLVGLQV